MAVAIAVVLATMLAYVELRSRLRTRFTSRAVGWWIARLAIEAVAAAIFALVLPNLSDATWIDGPAGGFAAGIAVPALLRLRLVSLRVGGAEVPIGVATAFEPIRNFFERQIDETGAAAQSRWLNATVLPHLKQAGWTPEQLGDRARTYVEGLTWLAEADRATAVAYIKARLDEDVEPDKMIRAIVQKMVDLRAYRLLDDLMEENPQ